MTLSKLFRFQKKIVIIPNLIEINLNKSMVTTAIKKRSVKAGLKEASITVANNHVGVNISKRGVEKFANLDGSGLSIRK